MPVLGAAMEAGTLIQWLKHPGDELRRGDIIAVVDTEKGAIEIEVFENGVLEAIRVQPGEKVPVGVSRGAIARRRAAHRPDIDSRDRRRWRDHSNGCRTRLDGRRSHRSPGPGGGAGCTDAPRDRCGDGAGKAGDSAFLSGHDDRHGARARLQDPEHL